MTAQAETEPGAVHDDDVLVRAAQRGDATAFEMLYYRYARMVHGILLARLPASEVEDLVQEVFLSALRKLKALREPAAFGGWLAAIARNRAADYHRGPAQAEQLDESDEPRALPLSSSLGDRVGQSNPSAASILDVIRRLPDAYRETLILRLVEGLTGPEIASRTGLTHGSVRVNLSRGMQMLREALGERGQP